MSRTCKHCNADKPTNDFPTASRMADGISCWCRDCHNEASRKSKAKKRAAIRAAKIKEKAA